MKRSSVAQLSPIRELLMEIAGTSLPPPSAGSLGMSRSALLKAELIKEAVQQFKLLEVNVGEALSTPPEPHFADAG